MPTVTKDIELTIGGSPLGFRLHQNEARAMEARA